MQLVFGGRDTLLLKSDKSELPTNLAAHHGPLHNELPFTGDRAHRRLCVTDARSMAGRPQLVISACPATSVVSDSLRHYGLFSPGSSVHGISQARILECVTISFFREGIPPDPSSSGIKPTSPELADGFFTTKATREALTYDKNCYLWSTCSLYGQ